MNIYLIERDDAVDYDEYDSAVVTAESEEAARLIQPNERTAPLGGEGPYSSWTPSNRVIVTLLGIAVEGTESKVICASFNAG